MKKLAINRTVVALGVVCVSFALLAVHSSAPKESGDDAKGKVWIFLSTDCPVALKYSPRIARLYESYSEKGFEFVAYFPNELETRSGIDTYMYERNLRFPWKFDLGGLLAKSHDITKIPCVIVFDKNGKKVYQGAIDDNPNDINIRNKYVENVLEHLQSGKAVTFLKTDVQGCFLMPGDPPLDSKSITFAEHVAPIVYRSCTPCHRAGEVAPFSLTSYEEVKKWAKMIAFVSESGRMPPWKAVDGYNSFKDANVLSPYEIETLKRWAEAGAPRGDKNKEPKAPEFSSEWPYGEPDLVISADRPFELEAEGRDVYRNFVIKTDFKETKYVKGIAVKPGNPKVVHHVIAFLDEQGRALKLQEQTKDGQPGYSTFGGLGFIPEGSLGGWAPGYNSRLAEEGYAFELKPGTSIVLQTHYNKTGKPEKDLTKVGIYFAKEPVKKTLHLAWIANVGLRIPPNVSNHKVTFRFPVPLDVTAHSAMPHMHLLGKEMKAWVELPDKTVKPMIWVRDWDFNWQMNYTFKEPMKIPRGSTIFVEAVYDNSEENPFQPNTPPKLVRWGEQTSDEMMLLVVAYTFDNPIFDAVQSQNLRGLLRNRIDR